MMAELNEEMGKIYSHIEVPSRIDAIVVIESSSCSPSYSDALCNPK